MKKHPHLFAFASAFGLFVALLSVGSFTAQAQPDFVVTEVQLSPAVPKPLEQTQVRATVHNVGDMPAGTFRVILRVDGRFAQSQELNNLGVGEVGAVEFSWFGLEGTRTLRVEANPYNDVEEFNKENNTLDLAVDVLGDPLPDLVIEMVQLNGQSLRLNQTVTLEIIVANVGRIAPDRRAVLTVKEGFKTLRSVFIDPVGPGERTSFMISWTPLSEGEAFLSFEVDAQERIEEVDEINNLATELFNISTRLATGANLTVTELSLTPQNAAPGDTVTLVATVENIGEGDASNFNVGFEANGGAIASVQVLEVLAPGAKTQVMASWLVPNSGQHLIRVKADESAVIIESAETDNALSTLVELGEIINSCGQAVYLRFDEKSIQILTLALNLTEEQVRNVFLPKIKNAMEADFEGLNIRFSLSEPRSTHSKLEFIADAPSDRLGQAPIDPGNVRKTDVGTVFIGTFENNLFARSTNRTLDAVAIIIANTASHEVGHFLGLPHDDLEVTNANNGLNMMADGNDANFASFFQDAAFTEENLDYLRSILPFECSR
jgi:hypothetical protein